MILCENCSNPFRCAGRESCHLQWLAAHPGKIEPSDAQILAAQTSMEYEFAAYADDGYRPYLKSILMSEELTEIRNMLRAALNA